MNDPRNLHKVISVLLEKLGGSAVITESELENAPDTLVTTNAIDHKYTLEVYKNEPNS